MSIISQFIYVGDLDAQEANNLEGYKVTAESSLKGHARLNSDDIINSQGVDLTASECRAIANMLISCAIVLESETN
ncbi:TPA: hypothetical protein P7L42_003364 [Vibrio cholerae]|uniref:hypothetical protein n=1 Tax=Vibrio cholerae TaxID=666 RepID=UPI001A33C281|nr:hypothetical protein [Vibrio cholerae]MCX9673867.1 hypothetical protein [Vibrio cholerae]MCX9680748.1 hypothetical protein [Vibrio cholerae]MCX9686879.1 hypothetical protein [Vibrio cholerae]MCX9698362.1 hypothetical protein [Vibrio cholerae]MCX9716041.1 hypothetical protein [Vibrio cholerae]